MKLNQVAGLTLTVENVKKQFQASITGGGAAELSLIPSRIQQPHHTSPPPPRPPGLFTTGRNSGARPLCQAYFERPSKVKRRLE